eukprot:CAMPEP_0180489176 /NCGR_PEP_ID=MMETSP1036_2-20121128/38451_1 /TAXON_ID=632150 /ORGANISM="Azadinium spinosum, Strain 3D9" /LENGTH=196 /DNA_ID=CAMNT_0022497303 /DNA_START=92 /DNA_END=678 /DNA_ORIENTATION=+
MVLDKIPRETFEALAGYSLMSDVRAALRPCSLVSGYRMHWPDITKPFPFTLDSKGPLFLEFQLIAAKAPNGTPRIGFVDAKGSLQGAKDGWSGDLSRGQGRSDTCAISFDPSCGGLCAMEAALEGQDIPRPASINSDQGYYMATLMWDWLGDCSRKKNAPINAGLFLADGTLTFYRRWGKCWHSSGIIFKDLPSQV